MTDFYLDMKRKKNLDKKRQVRYVTSVESGRIALVLDKKALDCVRL